MSYSRWINSSFYTYWCSSKVYDKQDELFACHASLEGEHMFTYTECKEFIQDPQKIENRKISSQKKLEKHLQKILIQNLKQK